MPVLVLPLGWILMQGIGRDPRTLPSPLITVVDEQIPVLLSGTAVSSDLD